MGTTTLQHFKDAFRGWVIVLALLGIMTGTTLILVKLGGMIV